MNYFKEVIVSDLKAKKTVSEGRAQLIISVDMEMEWEVCGQ